MNITESNSDQAPLLTAELAAVRAELARVDAKCATLTGLAGAALFFLLTQIGTRESWPVRVLLVAAGLALAAAAVLLLVRVLRPRLGTTGFCRYASMTGDNVRRELLGLNEYGVHVHQAGELVILSDIAKAKNRALQLAVALLTAGLALTCAALVAGMAA